MVFACDSKSFKICKFSIKDDERSGRLVSVFTPVNITPYISSQCIPKCVNVDEKRVRAEAPRSIYARSEEVATS